MFKEIGHLVRMEFKLELRQKHAIGSMMLYVISTIFVCYLSFKQVVNIPTWNALFWIIMVFAGFNSVGRGFATEKKGKRLFRYLLASPLATILSKIIYNAILLFALSLVSILFYSLFMGGAVYEEADLLMLFTALFLGSTGLASILTMIAAIASKSDNSIGITAILGFPVILPLLTILIRFSKNALDGIAWSVTWDSALILVLIQVLGWTLSGILFPYLWRD